MANSRLMISTVKQTSIRVRFRVRSHINDDNEVVAYRTLVRCPR